MDSKKIGTGMIFAACVLGMFFLTWFFGDVERGWRNPNDNPQSLVQQDVVEVSLKRNRQGHYMVTGQINGRPTEFLLDTGATDVVIPAELAASLGLKQGRPGTAMTANGAVTVYETTIDALSIADIHLYNVRASINPGMRGRGVLLGMSALGRLEFLQQSDSLTLRQKAL